MIQALTLMLQICRFSPFLLGGGWFGHLAWKKLKAYNIIELDKLVALPVQLLV